MHTHYDIYNCHIIQELKNRSHRQMSLYLIVLVFERKTETANRTKKSLDVTTKNAAIISTNIVENNKTFYLSYFFLNQGW